MRDTDSAAVIRLGFERGFLTGREVEPLDGMPTYRIGPDAIPELNSRLNRRIEVIAERSHARK